MKCSCLAYELMTGKSEPRVRSDDFKGDKCSMSGQAIQIDEHMTEKGNAWHLYEVQPKTTFKAHMYKYGPTRHDSTCITSLPCPIMTQHALPHYPVQ